MFVPHLAHNPYLDTGRKDILEDSDICCITRVTRYEAI